MLCGREDRARLGAIRRAHPACSRAAILTLPNLSFESARSFELARHSNPKVREAAVWMPSMQESPDAMTFEQLADDPDRGVRIAVAQALLHVASLDADSFERIRARLNRDRSGNC